MSRCSRWSAVSSVPVVVALSVACAPAPTHRVLTTQVPLEHRVAQVQPDRLPFTSFWNAMIPSRPVLDRRSASMVKWLTDRPHGIVADLYEHGLPIYAATASTPLQRVTCTRPGVVCDLERARVPVPAGARPNSGSDHSMVVVDWGRKKSYEFWRASRTSGGWSTRWGAVASLDGPGRDGTTGAGVSRLAGIVRTSEISRGVIPHALVFSSGNACERGFRAPATKTDGVSNRADCLPEGARLQLSPHVDINAIPNLTRGEKIVAIALQRYGAYVVDVGGARAAFGFEKPTKNNPYPAAGFPYDYWSMPHIPWRQLRALRSWDGR